MPDERSFPVFHTGGRRERDRYENMLILCISIMTNARGCGVSRRVVAWCLFLCASLVCGADYRPHIHGERTERTSRTHHDAEFQTDAGAKPKLLLSNGRETTAAARVSVWPRPPPWSSFRRRGVSHNIYIHSVTIDQVRIYLIAFIHPQCACSQSRGV